MNIVFVVMTELNGYKNIAHVFESRKLAKEMVKCIEKTERFDQVYFLMMPVLNEIPF